VSRRVGLRAIRSRQVPACSPLRSGLRCYRGESWEGVSCYRQVVEADHRDVGRDGKPSFTQGRNCSNRNRFVASEQGGWRLTSTQDFAHRLITACHAEITRGDQIFIDFYLRSVQRAPISLQPFVGTDVANRCVRNVRNSAVANSIRCRVAYSAAFQVLVRAD
jgi:hypothetical protein